MTTSTSTSSMAIPTLVVVLVLVFPLLFLVSAHGQGPDLPILHVNSPLGPATPLSWADSVLLMQSNDRARFRHLASLVAGRSIVPIATGRSLNLNSNYIVRANIGTPPQTLLVAIDTANDAAWLPCADCVGCSSVTFNPSKSTTFKPLFCGSPECTKAPNSCGIPPSSTSPCGLTRTYGDSSLSAELVQDSVKLAVDSIGGYIFGCVRKTSGSSFPAQGFLGLGRGPLSLPSQTIPLYQSIFSYCLPSSKSSNFSGSLRLGPNSQPKNIKTTPLLRNQRRPSLYYVNLLAIMVGKHVVNIPPSAFAFDNNTGGGTVFDSGTVFTILVKSAYEAVRDEVRRRMPSLTVFALGGFDTCYNASINVPSLTFVFDGMNVTLPQDNFIIRGSSGNTSCLAMAAEPSIGVNSVLNVIASLQQQNHRILIDGQKSRLGVAREQCS